LRSAFVRLAACLALLCAALLVTRVASAHAPDRGYLVVTETTAGQALVTLRAPGSVDVTASDGCAVDRVDAGARSQGVLVLRLTCPARLDGASIVLRGLAPGQVVVARVERASSPADGVVLTAASPRLDLSGAPPFGVTVRRYVRLGAEHVASGADHVLFLLALAWHALRRAHGQARAAGKRLLGLATAFTLAHSVTLSATVLGVLRFPTDIAEALIALSLLLVALDEPRQGTSPLLVGAFGLVHGLGFADGLRAAGLPERSTVPALVAFNVGVELAQAAVLGVVLLSLVALTRTNRARTVTDHVSRYAVGCAGAYLFLSRAALVLTP
jgi:hypothetical protein